MFIWYSASRRNNPFYNPAPGRCREQGYSVGQIPVAWSEHSGEGRGDPRWPSEQKSFLRFQEVLRGNKLGDRLGNNLQGSRTSSLGGAVSSEA